MHFISFLNQVHDYQNIDLCLILPELPEHGSDWVRQGHSKYLKLQVNFNWSEVRIQSSANFIYYQLYCEEENKEKEEVNGPIFNRLIELQLLWCQVP